MQKTGIAPLLATLLLLAGCRPQSPGSETTASTAAATSVAPAPAATAVTGVVKLAQPEAALAAGAKLQLTLVDVSQRPAITVNQQDVESPKFPQAFRIPVTASQIDPGALYVLRATLQNNGRTWTTRLQQPVLTHGQPANIDLTLYPEPTPAQKMLAAFKHAKRETGGMHVQTGTSSKIGESRGWQVFRDQHGVEFVIVVVNHDNKHYTETQYAYRKGLPWVVVRKQMPKLHTPATSVQRVGWGHDGAVVLNQMQQGGETGDVAAADIKALHAQAEKQYQRFSKQR